MPPLRGDSRRDVDAAVLRATAVFNVAVIPDPDVGRAIAALAAALPATSPLRVDGDEFRPHLTLYMARFERDLVDGLVDRASAVLDATPRTRMQPDGYNFTPGRYYEVSYRRSTKLMRLHRRLTRALQELRFRPGHPVQEAYFAPYTSDQRRHARRSGYDLSGRLYRPHITIGRLESASHVALPVTSDELGFVARQVGLFVADENGAARRLVREFTLPAGGA